MIQWCLTFWACKGKQPPTDKLLLAHIQPIQFMINPDWLHLYCVLEPCMSSALMMKTEMRVFSDGPDFCCETCWIIKKREVNKWIGVRGCYVDLAPNSQSFLQSVGTAERMLRVTSTMLPLGVTAGRSPEGHAMLANESNRRATVAKVTTALPSLKHFWMLFQTWSSSPKSSPMFKSHRCPQMDRNAEGSRRFLPLQSVFRWLMNPMNKSSYQQTK